MLQEFISFSFSIPNVHEGFTEVGGLAKASRFGLILEYEAKYLGLFKSGVKDVQIPIAEIDSVSLKEGWLKSELLVKARSLSTSSNVPGSRPGQVTLRIPRKEKKAAKQAASMLMLHITERELERLRKESERLADSSVTEAETELLP